MKEIIGEGSCEFRSSKTARVTFTVRDNATGEKYKLKSEPMRVSGKTDKEKKRVIREFRKLVESDWRKEEDEEARKQALDQRDIDLGLKPELRGATFGEMSRTWLNETRIGNPDVSASTLDKDFHRVDVANEYFFEKPVRDIDMADCERFKMCLTRERGLSGTTANGIFMTFRQVLSWGVRRGYIARNPSDGVKNVKRDTKEKKPMSPQEVARFVGLLDTVDTIKPTLVGFRLALLAGMRCGEVCAVRWRDYDSDKGIITVGASLCSRTLEFKEPKTKAGYRSIPLDADTVEWLNRYRVQQSKKLLALGKNVQDACIVADAESDYMHPCNLARSLKRFLKAHSFENYTMHQLRHTFCTLLIARGIDPATVQYLMGHASPTITLKIYTHYMQANGERAMQAIGKMVAELPESNIKEVDIDQYRWGTKGEKEKSA